MTTTQYLAGQLDARVSQAQAIVERCSEDGRSPTALEKAECDRLIGEATEMKAKIRRITDNEELRRRMEADPYLQDETKNMTNETYNRTRFADAIIGAGFDFKMQPAVEVSAMSAFGGFGGKVNAFPSVTDWNRSEPGMTAMGRDSRWLFPHLVQRDAGDAGSIQDYQQTVRTLVGTVERALDATSNKANLDVTLTMVNTALKQYAVTVDSVPNALFESVDSLRGFLEAEAKFQVFKALDAAIFAAIVAAGPPFGTTGTTLIDKLRNGVSSMRAEGANPDIAVLNSTDSASLDLTADAGGYVFAPRVTGVGSPLWDLTIVERTSATGAEPPYLIDSQMLGVLYLGKLRADIDPFTGFKANLSTLRVETKALFHIRNIKGARRIAAT